VTKEFVINVVVVTWNIAVHCAQWHLMCVPQEISAGKPTVILVFRRAHFNIVNVALRQF